MLALVSGVAGADCASAPSPMADVPAARQGAACRATPGIVWKSASSASDRQHLDAWCASVGPPVITAAATASVEPIDELVVVSWNVHVGAADISTMVRRLRSGGFTDGVPVSRFVLLLQEAYRADRSVPRELPAGVNAPKFAGATEPGRTRIDIVQVAQSLGLSLYYVPSMRNGDPKKTDEDRGNAMLSTEPLADLLAIELPFERQRRVAIAATVSGAGATGEPWTLELSSAHLESTATAQHLRVLVNGARKRQARGLLEALGTGTPLIIAGDFNTWFGFSDPTYKLMATAVPDASAGDHRSTYGDHFRLDHVFARPPVGWTATTRRLDERFGSDHYPMLTRVRRVS